MRVPPSRKRKRDGNAHLNNEGPEPNNGENITNNNEDDGRCQYCFLSPCIIELTSSSPWIGAGQGPSIHNPPIRKRLYGRFWSCISNLGGWNTAQYISKKIANGEGENVLYHQREIMPDCVLTFCRNKYPNPKGIPYLGHKWQ